MAKPELGTKRLCANCGAKFYDLNKDPIHCPKCETVYVVAPIVTRPSRPEPAPVAPRPAPGRGSRRAGAAGGRDRFARRGRRRGVRRQEARARAEPEAEEEEVEIGETLDDDTFIEEQEEEDADVTDIIGGDIENEEEG